MSTEKPIANASETYIEMYKEDASENETGQSFQHDGKKKLRLCMSLFIVSVFVLLGLSHKSCMPQQSHGMMANRVLASNDEVSHMVDLIHSQQQEVEKLTQMLQSKHNPEHPEKNEHPEQHPEKNEQVEQNEQNEVEQNHEKREDDKDKKKKKKKNKSLLDQAWVRFLLALAALVVINMGIICVVHMYMKITNSSKDYRTVEHKISPF